MFAQDAKVKAYLLVITATISSLLLIIILTNSINHLLCKKSITVKKRIVNIITTDNKRMIKKATPNIDYHPIIRYGTICSLQCYLICTVVAYASMIMILTTNIQIPSINPFHSTAVFSWLIGRTFMNSVFVSRLKHSFGNTKWIYPHSTFIVLYGFLSLFCISILYNLVMVFIAHRLSNTFKNIQFFINFSLIFVDLMFGVLLTILFQRKLVQLIRAYLTVYLNYQQMQRKEHNGDAFDLNDLEFDLPTNADSLMSLDTVQQEDDTTSSELPKRERQQNDENSLANIDNRETNDLIIRHEPKQIRKQIAKMKKEDDALDETKLSFINMITQYTILVSLSVITSFIVIVNGIWSGIGAMDKSPEEQRYILFIHEFTLILDSFMNALCLFLHFPFSLKLYKCLCAKPFCVHRMCVFTCSKCVE
eukprot:151922_1